MTMKTTSTIRLRRRRPPVSFSASQSHRLRVYVLLFLLIDSIFGDADWNSKKRDLKPFGFLFADLKIRPSDQSEFEIYCSSPLEQSSDRSDSPSVAPITGDTKADVMRKGSRVGEVGEKLSFDDGIDGLRKVAVGFNESLWMVER